MSQHTIGVLGGLGPLVTAQFQTIVLSLTDAHCDQDYPDMVITSTASTPDRTAYILGESEESPLPYLLRDVKILEKAGADAIVLLCNSAHCFYDALAASVSVPIVNLIETAADAVAERAAETIGIMATTGNLRSGLYQDALSRRGIAYVLPDQTMQQKVMEIIYTDLKATGKCRPDSVAEVVSYFRQKGADSILLGCTELSILYRAGIVDPRFCVDSLTTLAEKSIDLSGKSKRPDPLTVDTVVFNGREAAAPVLK